MLLPSTAYAESPAPATIDIDAALDAIVAEQAPIYPVPDVYVPPRVTLDQLSDGLIVKVQRALKGRGYPMLRADGVVGAPTRLALNAFLASHGWPSHHALTPKTLRALGIPIDAATP